MTTTAIQPDICERVKTSYGQCLIKPEFFEDFYAAFLGRSPVVAEMFANTNMETQRSALRAGITFLLQFAEGSGFAELKVKELGVSHAKDRLNISPNYYPIWVDALIETLQKHDKNWSPGLETDWREVLQAGIDRMIAAW